jgi:hypothetical protein
VITNVSDEYDVYMFYVEVKYRDGGSRFLRNAGTQITMCHNPENHNLIFHRKNPKCIKSNSPSNILGRQLNTDIIFLTVALLFSISIYKYHNDKTFILKPLHVSATIQQSLSNMYM